MAGNAERTTNGEAGDWLCDENVAVAASCQLERAILPAVRLAMLRETVHGAARGWPGATAENAEGEHLAEQHAGSLLAIFPTLARSWC